MVARHPHMSCAQLARELHALLPTMQGGDGAWTARVDGVDVYVLADEAAGRVRIMSPVARADRDDHELHLVLLSANFDRALEAHYSVHEGVVWCLFVHALGDLSVTELRRAVRGVVALAQNTGSTFASGEIRFTGTLGVEGGVP